MLFSTLLSSIFLTACVTRNQNFVIADDYLTNHQYEEALETLEDPARQDAIYPPADQVLKLLDIGMLQFYAGNYPQAQDTLTQAEYLMEELFTASVSQAVGSFIVNDTIVDYPGEPYEEFYTNVFKAISFLEQDDLNGAFVEIRRLNNKLNLLEDKYAELADSYNQSGDSDSQLEISSGGTEFYNSALGRYLSLLIYRADGDWDGARIDAEAFSEAFATQPNVYDFPEPDLSPLLERTEQARLNVLAFTGRVPEKRANSLFISTLEDFVLVFLQREDGDGQLITEEVDGFPWRGMVAGYQFKFELPYLEKRGSAVSRVLVTVDGQERGNLELIESMENVSFEVYKLNEPIIYLKTILRTVLKGLLNQELKNEVTRADGLLGAVFGLFSDVAVTASEVADLRAARYYPGFAYGAEFRLEPGLHAVSLEYYDARDNLIFREDYAEREYRAADLNIIHGYIPR